MKLEEETTTLYIDIYKCEYVETSEIYSYEISSDDYIKLKELNGVDRKKYLEDIISDCEDVENYPSVGTNVIDNTIEYELG